MTMLISARPDRSGAAAAAGGRHHDGRQQDQAATGRAPGRRSSPRELVQTVAARRFVDGSRKRAQQPPPGRGFVGLAAQLAGSIAARPNSASGASEPSGRRRDSDRTRAARRRARRAGKGCRRRRPARPAPPPSQGSGAPARGSGRPRRAGRARDEPRWRRRTNRRRSASLPCGAVSAGSRWSAWARRGAARRALSPRSYRAGTAPRRTAGARAPSRARRRSRATACRGAPSLGDDPDGGRWTETHAAAPPAAASNATPAATAIAVGRRRRPTAGALAGDPSASRAINASSSASGRSATPS